MEKGNTMTNKEQIISLLQSVKRPGMDAVIGYIEDSNYFTVNCHGHHFIGKGGVAEHSLEVYKFMKNNNPLNLPEDSIIILALCHDLGKCDKASRQFRGRGMHDMRSLLTLEYCGLELNDNERKGILNHSGKDYLNPLYILLGLGDCFSTGMWKVSHKKEIAARKARRASKK